MPHAALEGLFTYRGICPEVGIGMIPRGEVGLIFANVGAGIRFEGKPLIAAGVYAAIVLMVMATTVVTPPWLAQRIRRVMHSQPDVA